MMASAFQNPMQRIRLCVPALASAVCLFTSACAISHKMVDTLLADGPRGAVYIQGVEDLWFKTAHPLLVSPVLLTHVFRGVWIQVLPGDKSTAVRVFSDQDNEFLSPLISMALSKATKGQLVGFRVFRGRDVGSDTTSGVLYIQGRLLHLALTHYRANMVRSDSRVKTDRQFFNPRGLEPPQIVFVPETARRSSQNEQPDLLNPPPLATLVIDYELLKELETQSSSAQSPPLYEDSLADAAICYATQAKRGEEIRAVRELAMKKSKELDMVKKDVYAMQRQLAELEIEAQKMKKRQSVYDAFIPEGAK
jgi:hypothetical protein